MAALIAAALYLLAGAPGPPIDPGAFGTYPARSVVAVLDGDTAVLDVCYRRAVRAGREYVLLETIDVRVDGYNAPERRHDLGGRARSALAGLLGSGRVWVRPVGVSLGRTVARLHVERPDGSMVDVAAAMRARGLDVPWAR
jgi:endonuclease YncB( thermonuclease family)